jgi:metallo-beta-lactamase family protein
MECTYGDREHRCSHDDVEKNLERIVKRAAEKKGHILVPAFAIGRTQTLLYHLNTLIESGRVPNLPVAVDTPFGLRVTETYAESRWLFDADALDKISRGDDPLDFEGLYAVWKGRDSMRLRDVPGPMLIIAGSGMCTGGRIMGHLQELLPLESTTLLFVGFQAPGTGGRAIQEAAQNRAAGRGPMAVSIDGEKVLVRARIETLSGLSAHADRRELKRWLDAIPQPKTVALHHGEVDAQEGFRRLCCG